MPELPKTNATIESLFEGKPEVCRALKETAMAVHRGDYGPDADMLVAREDPGLDDTDRVKITMVNDVFRGETSEGEITNWEFYRDERKAMERERAREDRDRR